MGQVVQAGDGRRLAVESWGAPDGRPIILIHGTPGSRVGPRPRGIVLHRRGIRLISYDRPGYGGSDRRPGRSVADAAGDVATIADALGLDRFGVVGRSGGGPHALACAAVLPDRVDRAAALVSLAPSTAGDLDWYAGMAPSNARSYRKLDADPAAVVRDICRRARQIRDDPRRMLTELWPELDSADKKVVSDVAIRRILTDTYAAALGGTADGWVDDVLALRRPWGFEPSAIKAPVMLWHGGADKFSPLRHTYWLADQISDARVLVHPEAAHFGAVQILPDVLSWVAYGQYRPCHARPDARAHASERLRIDDPQRPLAVHERGDIGMLGPQDPPEPLDDLLALGRGSRLAPLMAGEE